jgi:hypothetical protein
MWANAGEEGKLGMEGGGLTQGRKGRKKRKEVELARKTHKLEKKVAKPTV